MFEFAKVLRKFGQDDRALLKAQRALSISQLTGSIIFVKEISEYIANTFYM